jgi:DNA-directed RNA polymerase subunit E'/Rpb7
MELAQKQPFTLKKYKKKEINLRNIYSRCVITKKITLPVIAIHKDVGESIANSISFNFEGKCINEGYVKPGSSKIITYSSGIIERGIYISFEVVFECLVCFQVEGALLSCVAKNITKAGIRAESSTETPSPIVVFIARDHFHMNSNFSNVQEGDNIVIKVIGQRFELNDKYISIIGELVPPKNV